MYPTKACHGIQFSANAYDFISKCLEKDPAQRIRTLDEVLKHKWFADIDIDKMMNKTLKAPYLPKLSNDLEDC